MTDTPARVFQQYLIDEGLGLAPGTGVVNWPVYRDNLPTAPDKLILVKETTPILDGRLMKSGVQIQHFGIQLTFRALTDSEAKLKGYTVQEYITEILYRETIVIASATYLLQSFTLTSGLGFAGEEEQNKRRLYTTNGTITLREL